MPRQKLLFISRVGRYVARFLLGNFRATSAFILRRHELALALARFLPPTTSMPRDDYLSFGTLLVSRPRGTRLACVPAMQLACHGNSNFAPAINSPLRGTKLADAIPSLRGTTLAKYVLKEKEKRKATATLRGVKLAHPLGPNAPHSPYSVGYYTGAETLCRSLNDGLKL